MLSPLFFIFQSFPLKKENKYGIALIWKKVEILAKHTHHARN